MYMMDVHVYVVKTFYLVLHVCENKGSYDCLKRGRESLLFSKSSSFMGYLASACVCLSVSALLYTHNLYKRFLFQVQSTCTLL